ncbi:MAG: hypothetical protein ABIJ97_11670 [Bacteroidota bacterium]
MGINYNENEIYSQLERFREILTEYPGITSEQYDNLDIVDKPSRTTLYRRFGTWEEIKAIAFSHDKELIAYNVKLAKQKQKFADTNRVERRAFREYARVENAVAEYNKELIGILEKHDLSKYTIPHTENTKTDKQKATGIIHFTDTHLNELVDLHVNKYDFKIASQRCHKFVRKAKQYFSNFNITNVLFAMTGDILNADSKLDKLLNQATNRSKATFLAVQITEQMILDLNKDYNISVACVSGNETRMKDDIAYSDILVTDNYDFTIYSILKYVFRNSVGILFVSDNNYAEQIITIGDQNILLTHGERIGDKVEHSVQQIKGKYAAQNIIIDFIIYGHLHSTRIGNTYARGGSMVGANAYSDIGLQLTSKASQNIHIIYGKNERDSIAIDLQDITGEIGYPIEKELEAYNAKSLDKTKEKKVIMEIVI